MRDQVTACSLLSDRVADFDFREPATTSFFRDQVAHSVSRDQVTVVSFLSDLVAAVQVFA